MTNSRLRFPLWLALMGVALTFGASIARADYTVTGQFLYMDRSFTILGFTGVTPQRPVRYADVEIWTAPASGTPQLLTSTRVATDQNGFFSITVPGNTPQPIKARCYAASTVKPGLLIEVRQNYNQQSSISDTTFGAIWTLESGAISYQSGASLDLAQIVASASVYPYAGNAFNIWDVMVDGAEFVAAVTGSYPPEKFTAIWSNGYSNYQSYYAGPSTSAGFKSKYAFIASAYDDAVVYHQFGHFVIDTFSKLDAPALSSSGYLPIYGDGNQDIRMAWAEGAAMFIGASIRQWKGYSQPESYLMTDGTYPVRSFEIQSLASPAYPSPLVNTPLASLKGSTNMLAVASALWGITNGPTLQKPFADVWKVLTAMQSTAGAGIDTETFWDAWFSPEIDNGSLHEMQTVFGARGIEFFSDAEEPDDAPAGLTPISLDRFQLAGGPKVVINEIYIGGANALELFNAGDRSIDLTGWTAFTISAQSSSYSIIPIVIPAFQLKAGGLVILTDTTGANNGSVLYFGASKFPWTNGGDGACDLRDSSGLSVDFVRWGGSKYSGGSAFTGANPAAPYLGKSLARDLAGTDTNSGNDWTLQLPSLGEYNFSGQEKHHTFYPAADADYTAFTATAGKAYLIETINLTGGADTMLDLIGPDGSTVLTANDDSGPTQASRILWTAPASGTYSVLCRRYSGSFNLARYGSYDLRIIEGASFSWLSDLDTLTVSKPGQGGQYQTIADAIAAAANGDTVEIIDSGKYQENLSVSGKSITIKAAAGQTPVLDATTRTGSPGLWLKDFKSMRIDGLTITGGTPALQVINGTATLANISIASSASQGILITSGAVSIANVSISSSGLQSVAIVSGTATILDTTILGGTQGINVLGGSATIINTIVARATDPSGYGDGVQVSGSGSSATLVNCTIVNNGRLGVGVFTNATAHVANSIIRDNKGSADIGGDTTLTAAALDVHNSLIGKQQAPPLDVVGKSGNLAANPDPKFVDPANNDYHLLPSSPAIDAGDPNDPNLTLTDIVGLPRSLDGLGSGKAIPDMGAYEYYSPSHLPAMAVFPQIAVGGPSGGEYHTSLIGINAGAQPAILNVALTDNAGQPLIVAASGTSGSSFPLLLKPGGTARLDTAAMTTPSDTYAGYARFLSNVPLSGSALFKVIDGSTITSEAGVGLSKLTKSFMVYVDNLNDARSGYAIANFGSATPNITMTLRDTRGNIVHLPSALTPSLQPGQHFAEFAYQRFAEALPDQFEGSIEVTSDQDIAAVALRFDNWSTPPRQVFSTIPVLVDEAATTLYFPQAADGGGYRTNFILVNPGTADTTAKLEFFDGDGNPLGLSIGGEVRTSYDVAALKAKGVFRLLTDGSFPAVRTGWVKVTASHPIGGSAIFQTVAAGVITSEAGVAASPYAAHFTAYVSNLENAQSGLAICNPNPDPVTITLNLKDPTGSVVATRQISLPPLGHVASFFSGVGQWFPAGYESFEGTLEVFSTGGSVSAVGMRYDNPGGTVFATIPVIIVP